MAGLTFSSAPVARVRELLRSSSARTAEGVFVVEGPTLIYEALASDLVVEAVYVPTGSLDFRNTAARFECGDGVIERVSTTVSAQPVLAIVRVPSIEIPPDSTMAVWCEEINDPGNLGTIVRAAEAAGADAVALSHGSVDPWNPKVVRAAAGSLFRMPVVRNTEVRSSQLPGRWLATVMCDGVPLDQVDLVRPFTVMMGNEAHGLSDQSSAACHERVMIPMAGAAESLNVAMAATIVLFESARQRRVARAE